MKKIISLALAIVMLACLLCMPAYAERTGSDSPNQSVSAEVQVRVDENAINHKYSVDIDYADDVLVFTYTKHGTWDPESYEYSEAWGEWDTHTITITNHSDMPIKYTATANVTEKGYGDLDIAMENSTNTIAACYPGISQTGQFAEIVLTIDGIPNDNLDETPKKLGNINISITNP